MPIKKWTDLSSTNPEMTDWEEYRHHIFLIDGVPHIRIDWYWLILQKGHIFGYVFTYKGPYTDWKLSTKTFETIDLLCAYFEEFGPSWIAAEDLTGRYECTLSEEEIEKELTGLKYTTFEIPGTGFDQPEKLGSIHGSCFNGITGKEEYFISHDPSFPDIERF